MSDAYAQPGDYFETVEVEECRDCGQPTSWTDYISPICPDCHAREVGGQR